MAAKKAAREKKYNEAHAKSMEKYKGTKAYTLMKKYGGADSHLTWAELKAGLQKDGKTASQIQEAHNRWVKASQQLSAERSANYLKMDTTQLNRTLMYEASTNSKPLVKAPAGAAPAKQGANAPKSSAAPQSAKPVSKTYADSVKWGLKVLQYTNAYRKSKNASPTPQIWNKELHDLCYSHSVYMANKDKLSHDKFSDRVAEMRKKGYSVMGGAENVAYNWGGSDPAQKAFT